MNRIDAIGGVDRARGVRDELLRTNRHNLRYWRKVLAAYDVDPEAAGRKVAEHAGSDMGEYVEQYILWEIDACAVRIEALKRYEPSACAVVE